MTLRQTDEEKKIPEWKSYVLSAEENRDKDALKIFSQIKKENNLKDFDRLLKDRIGKMNSDSTLVNFITTTLKVIRDNPEVFQDDQEAFKEFFNATTNHFPYNVNTDNNPDPYTVFNIWYSKTSDTKRPEIIKYLVQRLQNPPEDENYIPSLLNLIAENPQVFQIYKRNIREGIERNFSKYSYLSQFKDKKVRGMFVSENAMSSFVNSLEFIAWIPLRTEGVANFKATLRFWNELKLPSHAILSSFNKFKVIFKTLESQESDAEVKIELTKQFMKFVKNHKTTVDKAKEKDSSTYTQEISAIATILGNYYDQMNEQDKIQIMPVIDYIAQWDKNENQSILNEKISNFIETSNDRVLQKIDKKTLKQWATKYPNAILSRSYNNPTIFIKKQLYEVLDESQNKSVVIALIEHNKSILSVMKAMNYQIPDPNIVRVYLIERISQMDIFLLTDTMEVLENLDIISINHMVEDLKRQLVYWRNRNPNEKEGFEKLIRKYEKKKIFNKEQIANLITK